MLRHDPLICYKPEASSSLTRLLLHIQRDLNPFINKLHDLFKVCFLELTGCQSWSPWKSKIWVRELNPPPSKKIFFWDIDEVNQKFSDWQTCAKSKANETQRRKNEMKGKNERIRLHGVALTGSACAPASLHWGYSDLHTSTDHIVIPLMRVPRRIPPGVRALLSPGQVFLLAVMETSSRTLSARAPSIPRGLRSTKTRWLSVPPDRKQDDEEHYFIQ